MKVLLTSHDGYIFVGDTSNIDKLKSQYTSPTWSLKIIDEDVFNFIAEIAVCLGNDSFTNWYQIT